MGANDDALIGGVILGGSAGTPLKIMARGLGPSLASAGVAGALTDPILELYDRDGVLLASNDNWRETQAAEIEASAIPPSDEAESAIVATLSAGNYTAVLHGKGGATGVGLIEFYHLP